MIEGGERKSAVQAPGVWARGLGAVIAFLGFTGAIVISIELSSDEMTEHTTVEVWLGLLAGLSVAALGLIVMGVGVLIGHAATRTPVASSK